MEDRVAFLTNGAGIAEYPHTTKMYSKTYV
jgi:hypothetical protein